VNTFRSRVDCARIVPTYATNTVKTKGPPIDDGVDPRRENMGPPPDAMSIKEI
jgi:hypothetical protein